MKRFPILLFLSLMIGFTGYSQRKIKKAPPGTVQVNDTLFVDKTEVANIHWREYLYYLVKYDTISMVFVLPDTSVWNEDSISTAYTEYYLRHPGFNNYPVVGISYQQAIKFCKWRTFAANFASYIKENNHRNWQEHLTDSFPIKFYYRLPTRDEWERIAAGRFSAEKYPFGYDSSYKKWKGAYVKSFNCVYPGDVPKYTHDGNRAYYTVSVNSYFPNSSGTYNMIGNVAEMVAEEGFAKGGGFDNPIGDCKISSSQHYSKPERWLGFRCVAIMLK